MILVFGILGLSVCMIFGIVAWVMGSSDLQAMEFGEMDPAGHGLTKAGKICGQISVILTVAMFALWLLFVMLALGAGMAGA